MNKKIVRLRGFALRHWKPLSTFGAAGLTVAGALLWRLGSLVPGYSQNEVATYSASRNFHMIWNEPLNAPFHILVHLISYVFPHNLIAVRLASVIVGWLTIVLFCTLLYRWFGTRTALLGTLLFGTSSWFLHATRLGVPQVCFFGIIALVACGVWIRARKAGLAVILGLIIATGLLYTPGMVWFIAIGLLWRWKSIDKAFKDHLGSVTIGALLFLAGILPLAWHLYKTPDTIKQWLYIPTDWSHPFHFIRTILDVPLAFFVHAPTNNPEIWLGRLPVLSIFSTLAFLLGTYVFCKHFKLARVKLLIGLAILGSVVIGFTDNAVPLTVLVPFAYVVIAVGTNFFLELWLDVFPRNPIARSLGIGLFVIIIGLSCSYSMRSYFIAWPQATVTRNVFSIRQL